MNSYSGYSESELGSAFFMTLGLISIILYVVMSFFLGKVFAKAGVPAWKAWVPIYNQWTFLELGGQKGWIALLSILGFIPVLGLIPVIIAAVFSAIAAYHIGNNFGKESWFVVLYILFGPIWIIWLAVDKEAVWQSGQSNTTAAEAPAAASPAVSTEFPQATTPADQPTPPQPTANDENRPQQPPTM